MHKIQKFIEENFLIDHPDTGEYVPFLFRHVQQKYFNQLVNDYGEEFYLTAPVREQIIKARQEGFTSLILGIFASVMMLHSQARKFLEISYKIDATKQHFKRLKVFLLSVMTHDKKMWDESLDRKLFESITEGSELVLRDNKAGFYAGTATGRTGERGGHVHGVLFTESAHYPDTGILRASEIIEGTRQMVPVESGLVFRETTANGWNHEKKTWDMAIAGEVDYKPRFYGWREYYTPAQFEKIKMGFSDKSLIPQEYPETADEAFLYSGRPALNQKKLAIYSKKVSKPVWTGEVVDDGHSVSLDEFEGGLLKVWKVPRQGKRYLIAADVAEGVKGGDYSVAHVIDRSSWEQVAVWRGHLDPGAFGLKLCDLGYWYNNALLVPELNNHGWATIERIKQEEYPHLFKTNEIWGEKEQAKDGFPTNVKTRGLIISALRNSLEDFTIYINDEVTINELKSAIVNDSGAVCAPEGYFDDCMISLAIGVYCLKFLGLDETYQSGVHDDSPMVVTSVVGERGRRRFAHR